MLSSYRRSRLFHWCNFHERTLVLPCIRLELNKPPSDLERNSILWLYLCKVLCRSNEKETPKNDGMSMHPCGTPFFIWKRWYETIPLHHSLHVNTKWVNEASEFWRWAEPFKNMEEARSKAFVKSMKAAYNGCSRDFSWRCLTAKIISLVDHPAHTWSAVIMRQFRRTRVIALLATVRREISLWFLQSYWSLYFSTEWWCRRQWSHVGSGPRASKLSGRSTVCYNCRATEVQKLRTNLILSCSKTIWVPWIHKWASTIVGSWWRACITGSLGMKIRASIFISCFLRI